MQCLTQGSDKQHSTADATEWTSGTRAEGFARAANGEDLLGCTDITPLKLRGVMHYHTT
jgi:hypothetical protein